MTGDFSTARLQGMEMFFSELGENLGGPKNPLYLLHDRLKGEDAKIVDLVRGNVNEHGIVFPPGLLDEILKNAAEAARVYRPDSLGQRPARESIARYYGTLGIPADQVVITPGRAFPTGTASSFLPRPGMRFCAHSRRIPCLITLRSCAACR